MEGVSVEGRGSGTIACGEAQCHIGRMPYHQFKLGQTVEAPHGGLHAPIPRGPHIVVRLLPVMGGEPQYRIRSAADGIERVVVESHVRRVAELPRRG